jgi:hypothetical protein
MAFSLTCTEITTEKHKRFETLFNFMTAADGKPLIIEFRNINVSNAGIKYKILLKEIIIGKEFAVGKKLP